MDITFNVRASEYVALDDLRPFQGELKKLSEENHNKLRTEIIEDGFNFSPHVWLCDGKYYILDGHQRIYTLKQLAKEGYSFIKPDGSEQSGVPVNIVHATDIENAKRKVLQAVSQYGKLDDQGFKDFIVDVDFTMDNFDFPDFVLPEIDAPEKEGNTDDDEIPEVDDNPYNVERNDVWLLGNHRLMCGDSTSEEDVAKLMDGEKADMVFTDPPYGLNWSGGTWASNPIYEKAKEWDVLLPQAVVENIILMAEKVILWGGNYYQMPPSRCWLSWRKSNGMATMADFELAWTNFDKCCKEYVAPRNQDGKRSHPTQKPVGLAAWCLTDYSNKGDSVLDLFGGSGSTLIACEKTNRRCFMSEIDPHYCSVIIKRWEEFTGEKAIKHEL